MHLCHSAKEQIIVLASICRTKHLHDVGDEIHIVRISLETRSEQSDEVVAAGHLARDEEPFDVRPDLGVLLSVSRLVKKSDGFLVSVDHILGADG